MIRRAWLVAGILLLSQVSRAHCDEKTKAPSEREIKALSDQLVSPNRQPITGDEDRWQAPDYRLPQGFDDEKQRPVHRAHRKLRQLGPAAFPFLIKRWGDQRYCMTTSHVLSGYCHNETVGHICRTIIFDQLQPYSYWQKARYDPRVKPRRPNYPEAFLGSQEATRQWWQKHQRDTLYQMQREILDWVIAEEAKRPQNFGDAERRELQQLRKKLVQGGKPLPAGNYDLVDVER